MDGWTHDMVRARDAPLWTMLRTLNNMPRRRMGGGSTAPKFLTSSLVVVAWSASRSGRFSGGAIISFSRRILVVILIRMGWAGHVAHMGQLRNEYKWRVIVAVTLYARIREVHGSKPGQVTCCSEWGFRGSPQTLQANKWIVPRLGRDSVLPDPFKFIIYLPTYHLKLYSLHTVLTAPRETSRENWA